MRITALAGGVGGARLIQGFISILSPDEFTAVVNTGDDFWHLGLYICPDLDTVTYTAAGIANPETGWGVKDDSFLTLKALEEIRGPSWFKLGDKDLATHLERTRRLQVGQSLTEIATFFSHCFGIKHRILPMTDDGVFTHVIAQNNEELPFQEYFVKYNFEPKIKGVIFKGIDSALPSEQMMNALDKSDAVVICPSNPFVSIDPITSLKGVREILTNKYVICVSPILGGKAVKGPLAKMYLELGLEPNPHLIAQHYQDFLNVIYLDNRDAEFSRRIRQSSIIPIESDILLPDIKNRTRLAKEIIKHIRNNFR